MSETMLEQKVWGVPLGKYEFFIRYANQTFYTNLEGEVYDASSLFTGKDSVSQLKQLIFEEIDSLLSSFGQGFQDSVKPKDTQANVANEAPVDAVQATEKSALKEARDKFENFDFATTCRVLILEEPGNKTKIRSKDQVKHIIIQVGNLHTIAEYATYNSGRGWSFLRGSTSLGKVDGLGLTFPHEWKMRTLGLVNIHLFYPDDPRNSKDSDLKDKLPDVKFLAEIVPWIPQALDTDAHLRAYKSLHKQDEESLARMGEDITLLNNELSSYREALGLTTPDGQPIAVSTPKGFSIVNFFVFGIPVVAFGIIGLAFPPFGGFLGSILGLFTGGGVNVLLKR